MRRRLLVAVAVAAACLGLAAPVQTAAASDSTLSPEHPVEVTVRLTSRGGIDHRLWDDDFVTSGFAMTVATDSSFRLHRIVADLWVGGVRRKQVNLDRTAEAFQWDRAFGYGTAQLRNLRAEGVMAEDRTPRTVVLSTTSNAIQVRRGLDWATMGLQRKARKVTVIAGDWSLFGAKGKKSAGKVSLQRFSSGTWRHYRWIRLDRHGDGKVAFRQKKKLKYRLVLAPTPTIQGKTTPARRK